LASGQDLRLYCWRRGIPYYYLIKGDEAGMARWLSGLSPDLMVAYSMSQLLQQSVYSIPRFGTINLHPSLLPKYRGPQPLFWTYYFMDRKAGVTVHFVDEGEDTGAVIRQSSFPIEFGMSLPELQSIVHRIGVQVLLAAVSDIEVGKFSAKPQPSHSPTVRARNVDPSESLIDWTWSPKRIWHVLRGGWFLDSIQGLNGLKRFMRIKVLDYEEAEMSGLTVGRLYKDSSRGYFVACSSGRVFLSFDWTVRHLLRMLLFRWTLP
jgi:methionyl-tRNA formyltransferase